MIEKIAIPAITAIRLSKRAQADTPPGIEVDIVPQIGQIRGPQTTYRFPLQSHYQAAITALQSIVQPTTDQQTALLNLQSIVSNQSVTWAESILAAAELPTLPELWSEHFEDRLSIDQNFSVLTEGGIPVSIVELGWSVQLPYSDRRIATLNVGVLSLDGQSAESYPLELVDRSHLVTYLTAEVSRHDDAIDLVQSQINALPAELDESGEVQLESLTAELSQLESIRDNLQTQLSSLSSQQITTDAIRADLALLGNAILASLKSAHWPSMNLAPIAAHWTQTVNTLE